MQYGQQNKCFSEVVYLPILKLHSFLAEANLLFIIKYVKFVTTVKIHYRVLQYKFGGNIYFVGDCTKYVFYDATITQFLCSVL